VNPVITVCISVGASTLISAFMSYVAFRIQFERFLARDTEREKHWVRWQEQISKDVEQLKAERNFHVRIQHCEEFIEELRDWKHEKADPHIRAMGALNDRVTRLENAN
jgi:hypothetical protein